MIDAQAACRQCEANIANIEAEHSHFATALARLQVNRQRLAELENQLPLPPPPGPAVRWVGLALLHGITCSRDYGLTIPPLEHTIEWEVYYVYFVV